MPSLDTCLASQEIRELIDRGIFSVPSYSEERIQPSSFEPTIGGELFILDTDVSLFRPRESQTVYRTLLELPKRRRQRVDITGGFEVKRGYSYLMHLEEKISRTKKVQFILSSPKSSIGRTFPTARLLADYNASFDEIQIFPQSDAPLEIWLLYQPLAFNQIIRPGTSFNQLRFFSGSGAKLSPKQILKVWKDHPLLYKKGLDGKTYPIQDPRIANSLQIHLDLEGAETGGIVALRARQNPMPIDLSKTREYHAEDYFEPLKAIGGELTIMPGEHYLLASKEVLRIPSNLNAELGPYSHLGLSGPLHRAGFVDNYFFGDLVFEVTSQESTKISLRHGMPIGELQIFRTHKPDKLYGKGIGSHYQGQTGPKTAKYFKSFDFETAARSHAKLQKIVLVEDTKGLLATRKQKTGFELISEREAEKLIRGIQENPLFHSRYDCEDDPLTQQIIPYVLIFDNKKRVFSYVRASDIRDYGERKLFGKHSIGLGGHILKGDAPDYIAQGLEREVSKEETIIMGKRSKPIVLGTMYQPNEEVDQVHFGIVYSILSTRGAIPDEKSIPQGGMLPIKRVMVDPNRFTDYETWSRILIPLLPELYETTLQRSKS